MPSEKHTCPKHTLTTWWPPYHACGLGVKVLHDLLNAVFDIFQELFSNTGLCVQLCNAEMNTGQAGERGEINHLKYIQLHIFWAIDNNLVLPWPVATVLKTAFQQYNGRRRSTPFQLKVIPANYLL